MNYVDTIFRTLNHHFNELASSMDPARWTVLAVATVVLGFFLLRGNAIRSS